MFKDPIKKVSKGAKLFDQPLKNPHLSLFIANSLGCGKTNALLYVSNVLGNHYHRALWFAPQGNCDKTLKGTLDPEVELITEAPAMMKKVTELRKKAMEADERDEELDRVLVVFDDSIANATIFPEGKRKTKLIDDLLSLRHLQITCFITCHRFTLCPSALRNNSAFYYVFRSDLKDLKTINETLDFKRPNIFLDAYKVFHNERHDFILVDKNNQRLYNNLNELIYQERPFFIHPLLQEVQK